MAWQFDGQDDYAALADAPALTFPEGPWTLGGALLQIDNAGSGTQFLCSWGNLLETSSFNWWINEIDSSYSRQLSFRHVDDDDMDTVQVNSGTKTLSCGVWHHVLLRRSGNVFTQYLDGVAAGSTTRNGFYTINRSDTLFFGSRADLNATRFFPGIMAEWAKWDRALSAGEIAALAAGKTPDWFAKNLAWYVSMRDKPVEFVRRIPVKVIGVKAVNHPRFLQPLATSWAARAQGVAP